MTASVLRRLITTRPKSRGDDSDTTAVPFDQDESHSKGKPVKKKVGSQSWIPTGRKQSGSAVPSDLPGSQQNDVPFLPSSSVASLMPSHEAREEAFSITPTPTSKAASTLCLTQQEASPEHSSLSNELPRPSLKLDIPGPSLSFSVTGLDKPVGSEDTPDKASPVGSMNTVELKAELKARADEAAKAIGTALKEMRPETPPSFNEPQNPTPPLPPLEAPKHADSMPLPSKYNKDLRSRDAALPARRASVKKTKHKRATQGSSLRGAFSKGSQIRGPRSWALSENVTGILTGQRFKRIEVDEMLTPERLEELRRSREQARNEEESNRSDTRGSSDSSRSAVSDDPETPVEPFHLEDLPSRIEDSEIQRGTFLEDPSPCTPFGPEDIDPIPEFDELEELDELDEFDELEEFEDGEDLYIPPLSCGSRVESVIYADIPGGPPLPPLKNPARYGIPPLGKPLPEVPMVTLTMPNGEHLKRPKRNFPDLTAKEENGIVYLYSTPFTFNNPMFEHGPITFVKADISRSLQKMEETLDWTAFQMAILCAGDLSPDLTLEEDAKQVDDITNWFDSFGFETLGELVEEDVPGLTSRESATSIVSSSPSSSPSTVNTDLDVPVSVGSERPSKFWNTPSQQKLPNNKKVSKGPTPLSQWTGEESPHSPRDSMDSLPPSPMLPLVIPNGYMEGKDEEVGNSVPMGYNLHHDLGDFLRWEAENVYARGF